MLTGSTALPHPEQNIHVIQGEFAVSDQEDTIISTLLGSCVSACMWDPDVRVGGLNHIVLSSGSDLDPRSAFLGANAMEVLINGLIKMGARRDKLKAKLFGGARMIRGLSDVGEGNARFAREFLAREGIECVNESLGGTLGRKIKFWPTTGRVRMLLLEDRVVRDYPIVTQVPVTDDIELF
jgi:chemotaxis protein CheD